MKEKTYLLIGIICTTLIAGTLIVSLFYTPLVPDNSMAKKVGRKNAISVQSKKGVVTGDREKQSPLPTNSKRLKHVSPIPLAAAPDDGLTEDTADTDTAEKTDPANDINIVDKKLLRKQFPDKIDLIPITDEEVEARKRVIRKNYERFGQILANKATKEEINLYFDEKTRLTEDRIEILDYAISEFSGQLSEDGIRRQTNTLMILERQLSKIQERRERAMARLKELEAGNEDS